MAPRFPKLALSIGALLAGGLLVSVALAPAAAQQVSPIDGQVAVRSDGAVYLIANGQRRWVATVVITDEELDAYPEGEPIYSGLAPIGSQAASASPGPATAATTSTAPTTAAVASPPAPSAANTVSAPGSTTGAVAPAEVATPTGAVTELDPQIPIEVDVDGPPKFEPGEVVTVNLRSKVGVTCELAVKWPDGNEVDQQRQTADSQGECEYQIDIPANTSAGTVVLKGIAREGARMSRQDVEFEVIPSF